MELKSELFGRNAMFYDYGEMRWKIYVCPHLKEYLYDTKTGKMYRCIKGCGGYGSLFNIRSPRASVKKGDKKEASAVR